MYRNPVIPVATLIEPVKAGDPGIQGDLDSGALDQEIIGYSILIR